MLPADPGMAMCTGYLGSIHLPGACFAAELQY
jgi:hypothetical protein